MIKRYDGEKLTANQMAKEILMDLIDTRDYWQEKTNSNADKMTEKEIAAINKALEKQAQRIYKLLAY